MYERKGVLEYIIIDPKAKNINIFRRTAGGSKKFDETLSVKYKDKAVPDIKTLDLKINLEDIFTKI